jgi:mannitol-specific phosphotransferase system IIBC component
MLLGWAAVISALAGMLSSVAVMLVAIRPLLLELRREARASTKAVTKSVNANTEAIEVVHHVINQNQKDSQSQQARTNAALIDAGIAIPKDPTLTE